MWLRFSSAKRRFLTLHHSFLCSVPSLGGCRPFNILGLRQESGQRHPGSRPLLHFPTESLSFVFSPSLFLLVLCSAIVTSSSGPVTGPDLPGPEEEKRIETGNIPSCSEKAALALHLKDTSGTLPSARFCFSICVRNCPLFIYLLIVQFLPAGNSSQIIAHSPTKKPTLCRSSARCSLCRLAAVCLRSAQGFRMPPPFSMALCTPSRRASSSQWHVGDSAQPGAL